MSTDHHYHAGPIVLSPSPMGALSFPSPYTRTRRRRVSSSARMSSARSAAPTAWTLPKYFARTGIGTPSYLVPPLWVFYGSTAHATQHPPPHNSSSGVVRPPHSRPCTYPAGSILWLLASSPFSVFPIDPKPIILHRTIAASNRRLQQKRREMRGPPPDSRRPHLPNWHIPNLHTRPTDHPLPQPTPSHTDQLPGRRLEVPETRDGVPIFKPVHRRTRFSRTTHKASGIEIGGRCRSVDCLMEGRHYRSLRMTREEEEEDRLTGWWRTAGLCCVRNNLQVIQLFTILLGYFVKTGLFMWAWLLMVLWPAPWLVLLFEVSTTPAKGQEGLCEGSTIIMASPDDYAKKTNQHLSNKLKLKILFLILFTNIFTAYIFRNPSSALNLVGLAAATSTAIDPNNNDTSLSDELHTTQAHLQSTRALISQLHDKLSTSNDMIHSLQDQLLLLSSTRSDQDDDNHRMADVISLPDEVQLSIGVQKLPLGRNPRAGSDEIYPSVGAACLRFKDELVQYMTYKVGGECPVDDDLVQRLMMKGCEPLPKRRCHPKSPKGYVDPKPYPESLWSTPADTSIVWDPYPCKSYQCLIDRRTRPGFPDCKDCFYLDGREKHRWLSDNGHLDYGIEQVLGTKPEGTIRIGLDIGGGTGSFAARMRERNITIVTTSMNFDGPFNSFISSRGLISMHVTISERLPFFENTLDIVHSMHVLSNWIPDAVLEFTLFDIYRVLRPGGLFWLDRFFCYGHQLNHTYVPMFDRVGFLKRRWNTGMKTDRGVKNEWYFSALLEKPMS